MQIRQSRSLRICLVNWSSAFQFRICVKSIGIYFSGFFELRPVTPFFDTDNHTRMLSQILSEKKAAKKIVGHFYGHMHTDAIRYKWIPLNVSILDAFICCLQIYLNEKSRGNFIQIPMTIAGCSLIQMMKSEALGLQHPPSLLLCTRVESTPASGSTNTIRKTGPSSTTKR